METDKAETYKGVLKENERTLRLFWDYIGDAGIMVRVAASLTYRERVQQNALELIKTAVEDLMPQGPTFSMDALVESAPSLSFLVDCAGYLSESILPAAARPDEDTVEAALELFHLQKTQAVDEQIRMKVEGQ